MPANSESPGRAKPKPGATPRRLGNLRQRSAMARLRPARSRRTRDGCRRGCSQVLLRRNEGPHDRGDRALPCGLLPWPRLSSSRDHSGHAAGVGGACGRFREDSGMRALDASLGDRARLSASCASDRPLSLDPSRLKGFEPEGPLPLRRDFRYFSGRKTEVPASAWPVSACVSRFGS